MAYKRIKVAMICHFSNPVVRNHLPLDNRRLYSFVRKLLRLPAKGMGYGDIALWDTNKDESAIIKKNIIIIHK